MVFNNVSLLSIFMSFKHNPRISVAVQGSVKKLCGTEGTEWPVQQRAGAGPPADCCETARGKIDEFAGLEEIFSLFCG